MSKYIISCTRMRKPINKGDGYIDNTTSRLYCAIGTAPALEKINKQVKFDKVQAELVDKVTAEPLGKIDPQSFVGNKLKEWDTLTWEQLDVGFMGTVGKVSKSQKIRIKSPENA